MASGIVSLIQAGAHACFAEDAAADIFLKSLELVMLGETFVPSTLLPSLGSYETPGPAPADNSSMLLSPQEERVLSSLIEGKSNKVIARELGIADATVKIHLKNIFRELRVDNRTQAAAWAMNRASPNWRSERPSPTLDVAADEASAPAIPGPIQVIPRRRRLEQRMVRSNIEPSKLPTSNLSQSTQIRGLTAAALRVGGFCRPSAGSWKNRNVARSSSQKCAACVSCAKREKHRNERVSMRAQARITA